MRTFMKLTTAMILTLIPIIGVGCSEDDDSDNPATGGKSETGGRNQAGEDNNGTGGSSQAGAPSETGGSSEAGAPSETGGSGNDECDLSRAGRGDPIELTGNLDSMTLEGDKLYLIRDYAYVKPGETLTIEPCTRIEGEKDTLGVLVIQKGAKIMAEGTADAPILFTANTSDPEPGDWGGLVLLGQAEMAQGDALIEGMEDDPKNHFGGDDNSDDSGVLKYVRIEYPGIAIAPDSEINGLSLGAIGDETTIDYVMVSNPLDDCFEFFGGTVNAKHLICENPGDDMFDTDDGFQGSIEYAFGRHGAPISEDPNGFEWDGTTDYEGSVDTDVSASHVTMCGSDDAAYAMVLRRGIQGDIEDTVAVGFPTGFSLRDGAESEVSIADSVIVSPALSAIPDPENPDSTVTGDGSWFTDDDSNSEDDPGFDEGDCMGSDGPNSSVTGSEVGAFSDGDWVTGWTGW